MDLSVTFRNEQQRGFYYSRNRNQCYSGGFNNGKTFTGCLKAISLLTGFPKYKMVIARQTYTNLKRTTMQTFMKMLDSNIIERHNEQDGLTTFKNGSIVHWMHLDNVDESDLRGLEINSVLVDQAEETQEKVYDVLDSRIGRWDGVQVPDRYVKSVENWPMSPLGKPLAPSYMMLLCNPDTQFHYIYRKYHPDSLDRRGNHFYVEGEWDKSLGSEETYEEALKHDPEWVAKYVKGQWGASAAQIHRVWPESLLEPTEELIEKITKKGNLFRSLDHGDTSPTCCLWSATIRGVHIFYREYYVPDRTISFHRKAITDLSPANEQYSANYADPQLFKQGKKTDGGWWTLANEYSDMTLDSPPLHWIPADNNELATRNRINELLASTKYYTHPVTGVSPAPGIYFIKKTKEYPYGCYHSVNELQSQRRKLLGYYDGKAMYCDDREESVVDHGYDCIRYKIAMHGSNRSEPSRKAPRNSFKYYHELKKRKLGPVALSV